VTITYCNFTGESAGETILNMGQPLAKLSAREPVHLLTNINIHFQWQLPLSFKLTSIKRLTINNDVHPCCRLVRLDDRDCDGCGQVDNFTSYA